MLLVAFISVLRKALILNQYLMMDLWDWKNGTNSVFYEHKLQKIDSACTTNYFPFDIFVIDLFLCSRDNKLSI